MSNRLSFSWIVFDIIKDLNFLFCSTYTSWRIAGADLGRAAIEWPAHRSVQALRWQTILRTHRVDLNASNTTSKLVSCRYIQDLLSRLSWMRFETSLYRGTTHVFFAEILFLDASSWVTSTLSVKAGHAPLQYDWLMDPSSTMWGFSFFILAVLWITCTLTWTNLIVFIIIFFNVIFSSDFICWVKGAYCLDAGAYHIAAGRAVGAWYCRSSFCFWWFLDYFSWNLYCIFERLFYFGQYLIVKFTQVLWLKVSHESV